MAARLEIVGNASGIVETARAIALERRKKLLSLCDAVLNHNYEIAENFAKELRGNVETSNRTDQSFDRRASR